MFKLKKSLGQNFLVDKNIINKIVSVEILKNQNVIEIGSGSGNLSKIIIQKGIKNFLANLFTISHVIFNNLYRNHIKLIW